MFYLFVLNSIACNFATDAEESSWIEKNCRKGWDQIVGFENFNKLLEEDVTENKEKVKNGDSV